MKFDVENVSVKVEYCCKSNESSLEDQNLWTVLKNEDCFEEESSQNVQNCEREESCLKVENWLHEQQLEHCAEIKESTHRRQVKKVEVRKISNTVLDSLGTGVGAAVGNDKLKKRVHFCEESSGGGSGVEPPKMKKRVQDSKDCSGSSSSSSCNSSHASSHLVPHQLDDKRMTEPWSSSCDLSSNSSSSILVSRLASETGSDKIYRCGLTEEEWNRLVEYFHIRFEKCDSWVKTQNFKIIPDDEPSEQLTGAKTGDEPAAQPKVEGRGYRFEEVAEDVENSKDFPKNNVYINKIKASI